ncbi:hypothetical protein Angca_002689 [Angiostrongylus cantonensis]|nr:hypothetical protein Angca_002689 [Angiostrongylus cantonensis]
MLPFFTALLIILVSTRSISHDEQSWETLQVIPHVSGLRVENPIGDKGFIGYTEAWELIVEPNVPVLVVVFGYWLDKIEYITFTDSICLTSEFNISRDNFVLQTETRIELRMSFPNVTLRQFCYSSTSSTQIDDDRTWINPAETMKEHYMPLFLQITVLVILFAMSALFSGLNLGLMSLSIQELKLIIKSGSKKEAKYAKTILPVRKMGNYLLCTILIMNVVVNAAISILFEDLTSGSVAFITASLGIVVFGEIVPQSACVKHGLAIGARTILLTRFFMWITCPLSYPISKILDLIIGEEVDQFDRRRLMEILKMTTEANRNMDLAADLKIAVGAMEFTNKVARDVMTRIEDVFMLSENEILDATTMTEIVHRGYTRIPVYEDGDRNKVKSLLLVKDLALIDKKNNIPVKAVAEFNERQLRIIREDMPLPELLDEFKEGNYHLAMVRQVKQETNSSTGDEDPIEVDDVRQIINFVLECCENNALDGTFQVTLEDILEEILQSEILDESDSVVDNVHRRYRRRAIQDVYCGEGRSDLLSLNMLEVVSGWLVDRYTIFSNQYFEKQAREKMIQKNIRHVILLPRTEGDKTIYLYEAGVASKRFILILEGKAVVTFPKNQMSFDVGPWASFGEILLEKLSGSIRVRQEMPSTFQFTPDFSLLAHESCRFLQIPVPHIIQGLRISQFIRQLRTPRTSTSENDDSVSSLLRGHDQVAKRSIVARSRTAPERIRSLSMISISQPLRKVSLWKESFQQ